MARHRLAKRYGRAQSRTALRIISRRVSVSDAPGGHHRTLEPGDRIEVGGSAANKDYLVAHRVQQLGRGWERLGPFAVVACTALEPAKKRRGR
jgi:hypothetical protein